MKKILSLLFALSLVINIGAQTKYVKKPAAKTVAKKTAVPKANPDLTKVNDSIPALIPQKKNGKFGFINQKGKVVIPHQYSNVGFYGEDCNLLNSKNEKVKKYGSDKYASVRLNGVDYRIDYTGKRVYKYQDSDLAKCPFEYKKQLFHAYNRQGYYGVIEDSRFENAEDYRHYQIYPQYEYLHIMEGDDLKHPMIIASYNNKFGVIDINNKVVIPFIYSDIKRNFSWKLARLFEVTTDGKNYFYVDDKNTAY
ncbi:WG repeat-containing protein [Chryseobacterium taklimakanense]|uniref:WG repeat-containing protein n=1 Tax=Chryseobacterium taklimakanense TaxID=536441 RepID=UPI000F5DDE0E|nr:WG repeat-containing protein [Chryseobacterium taklimakanense]AZI21530.1 WG repeat-containing protein [Chryseobacterium taklimakanense]